MLSNVLGAVALVCLCVAVGGLAGALWAVLLLGLILAWMAYVAYQTGQKDSASLTTAQVVEAALEKAAERAKLEQESAVSRAVSEVEERYRLEELRASLA